MQGGSGGRGGGEGDAATFPFGKHRGKSFQEVMESDPSYCQWALKQDAAHGLMKEFQSFLKKKGFEGNSAAGSARSAGGLGSSGGGSSAQRLSTVGGRLPENVALVFELAEGQRFRVYAEQSRGLSPPPFLPPQVWSAISSLEGAQPSNSRKSWLFPLKNYQNVLTALSGLGNVEPIPDWVRQLVDRAKEASRSDKEVDESAVPEGLLPYQREGLLFGLSHGGRILIGDEMGLGKTLQALALSAQYMDDWPALIVCPTSLRWVWKEQILQWLPKLVGKDDVQVICKGSDVMKPDKAFFIISYGLLGTNAKKDKFTTRPDGKPFGIVIADESHNIKEWQAERTKAVIPLLRKATRCMLLSGTPTRNAAYELHPQLCGLLPFMPAKFMEFKARYCIQQSMNYGGRSHSKVVGARNAIELYTLLTSTAMVRRLKKDVLVQLPTLRRQRVPVDIEDNRILKSIHQDLEKFGDATGASAPVVWQRMAKSKLKAVKEYMEDVLERGDEKIIVFAHHQVMMDGIGETLQKQLSKENLSYMRIDGSTSGNKRMEYVKKFQEDSDCRVALLSITACGEGISLTAAGLVIFAELYWVPGAVEQAEARAHRVGSTHQSVIVEYLVVPNSPDEHIFYSLERKKKDTSSMLNGATQSLNVVQQPLVQSRKRPAPSDTEAPDSVKRTKAEALLQAKFLASAAKAAVAEAPSAVGAVETEPPVAASVVADAATTANAGTTVENSSGVVSEASSNGIDSPLTPASKGLADREAKGDMAEGTPPPVAPVKNTSQCSTATSPQKDAKDARRDAIRRAKLDFLLRAAKAGSMDNCRKNW